ncbi:MAG: hypothetical protein P8Y94_03075, partial [Acidobacteriota bacterium]
MIQTAVASALFDRQDIEGFLDDADRMLIPTGIPALIPNRGAWLEFETSKRDILTVKVDRKRKLPVTILLRAVGFGSDEELHKLFDMVDIMPDH